MAGSKSCQRNRPLDKFDVFNAILMVLFIVITFYPLYDVIMARRETGDSRRQGTVLCLQKSKKGDREPSPVSPLSPN